ncbi:MAG TPA: hypothetical protein VJQ79_09675 [Acidimicrobiia bacterium]|nr:hypothetical protein [Acidimicrobiia bacterium]
MGPRHTRNRAVIVALIALILAVQPWPATSAQAQRGGDCDNDSLGLTPLIDMGRSTYLGAEGGLYPGGSNTIPTDHLALGMSLLSYVGPLNAEGQPDEAGKIGFMGVGVSTTGLDWDGFASLVSGEVDVNPQVVLVNGGVSGNPIAEWVDPSAFPWGFLNEKVVATGLSPAQIQVAWVMMPERPPNPPPFPERAEIYKGQLQTVLRILKANYPNLHLAYISSHQYAGYGTGNITEPGNGYEHGFGVKWTIESQILGEGDLNADPAIGPITAPWIAWGPYTWADGLNPRSDGLIWECSDFGRDGSHPSSAGSRKLGGLMLDFFTSDPTATPWFLGDGIEPRPSTPTTVAPTTTVPAPATTTSTTEATSPTTSGPSSTSTRPENNGGEGRGSDSLFPIVGGGLVVAVIAFIAAAVLRNRSAGGR